MRGMFMFMLGIAVGALLLAPAAAAEDSTPGNGGPLRIGLLADVHYSTGPNWSNRHYSLSLDKCAEAVEDFNAAGADFIVALGDSVDEIDDPEATIENLQALDAVLAEFNGDRHYVLGNHCLGDLTKEEFRANTLDGAIEDHYYGFSMGGYRFLLLDANYRQDSVAYARNNFHWEDTYIPFAQREWLRSELAAAAEAGEEAILFIHQILCDENDPHGVKNGHEIRHILEEAGNVAAVFQAHMHGGARREINGIPYVTLQAMVAGDDNAYALLTIEDDGVMTLEGFGREEDGVFGD